MPSGLVFVMDVGPAWPFVSFTMKHEPLSSIVQGGGEACCLTISSTHRRLTATLSQSSLVKLLKQRFGPVAPAVKFVHWICEEMDQGLPRYSV